MSPPPSDGFPIPVLWLCGPPGVGKTTVAVRLHAQVPGSAYVDIDQLGMCYPEPADDPGRHRMQLRNLEAVVAGFAAAGAASVVVSGVTDTAAHPPARSGLVVCRLRADRHELLRRYDARGSRPEERDQALDEADKLDASGGPCVDTTGLTVAEVITRVRETVGDWPGGPRPLAGSGAGSGAGSPAGAPAWQPDPGSGPGSILFLCGVTGSGKSTVGFPLFLKALRAGLTAAFVDADQLGMYRPGGHALKAANLARVWQTFRAAGARAMVAVGPVEDEDSFALYAKALAGETVTLCRLHAGLDDLTTRILLRGNGGGWDQPGDPLRGRPGAELREAARLAALQAEVLERKGIGHHRVDTAGKDPGEVADLVAAACHWPPAG